jgi:hypothetical protein
LLDEVKAWPHYIVEEQLSFARDRAEQVRAQ